MMDESNGWGLEGGTWENNARGHILQTQDSGATWQDVTPPQGAYKDGGFFALDANTAWASPFGTNCQQRADSSFACATPNQTNVWATRDGGKTWTASEPICIASACDTSGVSLTDWILPGSIYFLDAERGWFLLHVNYYMSQDRYKIYHTKDSGHSWQYVTSSWENDFLTQEITGIIALDELTLLLTTDEIHGAMVVHNELFYYRSQDGGETWKLIKVPLPSNPLGDPNWNQFQCGTNAIKLIASSVMDVDQECVLRDALYAIQQDRFLHLHSSDGGQTWTSWERTGDVQFISASIGWQLAAEGDHFALEQTRDGGQNWTRLKTVEWSGTLDFVNERQGWALAHGGEAVAVLRTIDGGKTWEIMTQARAAPMPTP
jgi:photosystem II stability/assembly factor-like uncharacterized protein